MATDLVIRVAANLAELRTNLAEGVSQIETTRSAIVQMSNAYDGSRIISQANATVAAIQQIGGVMKLTADEQARVSSVVEAAIDKYRALGREAPAALQQLAAATKDAGAASQQTFGEFLNGIPVIGQFIAALTIEKVFEFAKEMVSLAGKLDDLSIATGISREDLQKLAIVAGDFGLDLDTIGKAVSTFSEKLVSGDQSALGAVRRLGLSAKDLIAAGGMEAFLQFTDAAGRLESPMLKNGAAADAFGTKLGRVLVPTMGQFRAALNDLPKASVASEEDVKTVDAFGDALGRLWAGMKGVGITAVANTVRAYTDFRDVFNGTFREIKDSDFVGPQLSEGAQKLAAATKLVNEQATALANTLTKWRTEGQEPLTATQKEAIEVGLKYGIGIGEIAKEIHASQLATQRYADEVKKATEESKKWAEATEEMAAAGEGWRGTLAGMDGDVSAAIAYYLDAGVAQDKLATAYRVTATEVKAVATALAEQKKEQQETTKLAAETTATLNKLWNEYDDLRVQHGGTAYEQQVSQIRKWAADTASAAQKAGTDTLEFYVALQANIEEKVRGIGVDWQALAKGSRQALEETATKAQNTFQVALANVGNYTKEQIDQFQDLAIAARKAADEWGTASTDNSEKVQKSYERATAAAREFSLAARGSTGRENDINFDDGAMAAAKAGVSTTLSISGLGLGHRAGGGPVAAGSPYMVGERGPEMFVPDRSGAIVPNGGGMTIVNNISINGSVLSSKDEIARVVGDAMMSRLRGQGFRAPSGA